MTGALQRARELLRMGRARDAALAALDHLRDEPDDPGGLAMLALAQFEAGDDDLARATAKRALHEDPDHQVALVALAHIELEADRTSAAREAIERIVELDPDDDTGWHLLARVELLESHNEAALEAIENAVQCDPDDVDHRTLKVEILRALGRRDEARSELQTALALAPGDDTALRQRADLALRDGDFDEALDHYLQALRADPGDVVTRRGMLEALRARSVFYRVVLALRLWLHDFVVRQPGGGVVLILVMMAASRVVHPAIRPAVLGVLLVPTTIADFFLMWHPIGRHALSKTQKVTATIALVAMLAAAGFGVARLTTGNGSHGDAATRCLGAAVLVAVFGFAIQHSKLDAAARRRITILLIVAALLVVAVIAMVWSR